MKSRTWAVRPALLFGAAHVLSGACSSSASSRIEPCGPGETISCTTPEGCPGTKTCKDDGNGFRDCECEDGSSGAAGTPGQGGAPPDSGGNGGAGTIGDAGASGGPGEAGGGSAGVPGGGGAGAPDAGAGGVETGAGGAAGAGEAGAASGGEVGTGGECGAVEELSVVPCGNPTSPTLAEYSGIVEVTVAGFVIGPGPTGGSDPFYSGTMANDPVAGPPCPECFRYNRLSESGNECIGGSHAVLELLVDAYPDYSPNNSYSVRFDFGDAPPERIAFSTLDCGCHDNAGTFEMTLTPICD